MNRLETIASRWVELVGDEWADRIAAAERATPAAVAAIFLAVGSIAAAGGTRFDATAVGAVVIFVAAAVVATAAVSRARRRVRQTLARRLTDHGLRLVGPTALKHPDDFRARLDLSNLDAHTVRTALTADATANRIVDPSAGPEPARPDGWRRDLHPEIRRPPDGTGRGRSYLGITPKTSSSKEPNPCRTPSKSSSSSPSSATSCSDEWRASPPRARSC